ncbi:hypothetical protein M9H77_16530 [Catharanthus roseus]|uniref:Uncharacterized protein n=1 Tax=Catharanthus roseus TaxID=4058 RepID=A0ACC0B212_CATRO|nr:hypothetical protein M9H77_16530 [Catharanthus roseus]
MREHLWVGTLVTQILICSVLFIIIKIGEPQNHVFDGRPQRRPLDVLFLSVLGGHRRWQRWRRFIMHNFVVDISELREEDPLAQNIHISVYSTKTLKGHGVDHYLKQAKIPYAKSLDLIAVNSDLFQGYKRHWNVRTGNRPMIFYITSSLTPEMTRNTITGIKKGKKIHWHNTIRPWILPNLYLSGLACAEYVQKEGALLLNNTTKMEKRPYLISVDKMSLHHKLVTRIILAPFQLFSAFASGRITYFVSLRREVVERRELQQRGNEVVIILPLLVLLPLIVPPF